MIGAFFMPRFRPLALLFGGLGLLGRESTAADRPPRPMVISEAQLPEGFPPPGPVGVVITKDYPACRLARTRATSGDGGMFMKLFRHIEREDIAMTAPVEMTLPAGGDGGPDPAGAMAFLYASPTIGTPGPDPVDHAVVVEDVTTQTVASVGVRGGYDPATFARAEREVRDWLREHPDWEPSGPPRALAYNSPFVPGVLKYAEVQIPVTPRVPPAPGLPGLQVAP